jgi:hypothetical protein
LVTKEQLVEQLALQYIERNPECTKTSAINYMAGYISGKLPSVTLSPRPTHKMLNRFIDDKKVLCKIDGTNPRIHHLRINDKHSFNVISKALSVIGEFIDLMGSELSKSYGKQEMDGLIKAYSLSVPIMLQALLIRTSKTVADEKSRQLLHARIISLTEIFSEQLDINDQWFDFGMLDMYLGKSTAIITSNLHYSQLQGRLGLIFEHFKKTFLKAEWRKYQDSLCDNHCNGPEVSKPNRAVRSKSNTA